MKLLFILLISSIALKTFAGPFPDSCLHPPGDHILLIGDSHVSGYFGDEFAQALGQNLGDKWNYPVQRVGVVSANISDWTNGQWGKKHDGVCSSGKKSSTFSETSGLNLQKLLEASQKNPPKAVVVALGTNDLDCHHLDFSKKVSKLLASISEDTPCVWIGPPVMPRAQTVQKACGTTEAQSKVIDALKTAVEHGEPHSCHFVDSRAICVPVESGDNKKRRILKADEQKCFAKTLKCPEHFQILQPDVSPEYIHASRPTGNYWGQCAAMQAAAQLKTSFPPVQDIQEATLHHIESIK